MNMSKQRITALDYARAWAIFGMIMVNYKLAMGADGSGSYLLRMFSGIFEGRASALFVVLAGIGVSLMTAKARNSMDREVIRLQRKTLYKRAAFLFVAGVLLLLTGWSADILHYYAFFMLVASVLIVAPDRVFLVMSVITLLAAQIMQISFNYGQGWDPTFHEYNGFWTVSGFMRNLLFNGFHPVFPWACFFLIGMWMGRQKWLYSGNHKKILLFAVLGMIVFELLSWGLIQWSFPVLDANSAHYLFSTKPMPPTMLYVLSSTCSAVAVIMLSFMIVERSGESRITRGFIHTGQLSLSHYLGHVLIGLGLLETVKVLDNGSLAFAIAYGCGYFLLAVIFSYWWRKKWTRGPVEWIMRKLT
ncbi:DUF418 domain-containing protein [Paenibacillus donghaensis]|uniref:DUF418 domain-containing protein n=1 Tax=Paenibacillus donghaensis TaxID=414771 RepID=UPI0018842104|nr:DUF418 domain-containing protein [Paenibacillus donghaensis]MBE9916720.1 DUF418 domain-containing protein [Paenibacillus donghaensis]